MHNLEAFVCYATITAEFCSKECNNYKLEPYH